MKICDGLAFDDALLVPKYSTVKSRKNVDLSVDLGKGVKLEIPIISANMKKVTGFDMCFKLAQLGGLPIMHRFYDSIEEQAKAFTQVVEADCKYVGVSVGVGRTGEETFNALVETGANIFCLDIAHADSLMAVNMVKYINKAAPQALLIAGNVATGSGAQRLADVGADVIKVGIGGGSICSTRIETGNGVPSLTALDEAYEQSMYGEKYKIIADGGLKKSGDITKALCFSHAVMLGNLLAGTDEAPGEIFSIDNILYKTYAGSSTHKTSHVEGVVASVPYKGPVENIIIRLMEGLRSGCSYQGAHNLKELREDPEFVSISNTGLIESRPHDVLVKS
jgi:IMP dehydrogenase